MAAKRKRHISLCGPASLSEGTNGALFSVHPKRLFVHLSTSFDCTIYSFEFIDFKMVCIEGVLVKRAWLSGFLDLLSGLLRNTSLGACGE